LEEVRVQDESKREKVRIEHLAGHNHVILTLASWIREEWGHSFLEATFEELRADLERRTTLHTIPETFVALEGDRLVGTASLVTHDMSIRLGLSPWLSAVYVPPEFRNRGIGSKLVRRAMQEAEILGVEQLYLFTPDRMRFYTRLGWNILEQMEYHGQDVVVMRYKIV
jgi:GNAT superfamily N-acetyltransferase